MSSLARSEEILRGQAEAKFAVAGAEGPEALAIADMPSEVLDNRLGELCQKYLLPRSPRAYAWPGLLAVAGTMSHQASFLRSNLFSVLVGPVETGKSSTVENSCSILGLSKDSPEMEASMAGSAEGLLRKIGDAEGCARLYAPDELSHLFSKAQIERASFAPILQRAYYNTAFELVIAKGQTFKFNCSLGFVGGLVYEKFDESFTGATTAGLHSRCIFGLCPQPFAFDYRPFEPSGEVLPAPVRVDVDPDVWELKSEWLKTVPGITGRIIENALRVASICAGFDGRSVLKAADLGPAKAFAQYQIRVRAILQPNPGENPDAICAFAILRKLEELGPDGEWVSKRIISRAIHADRFGPGVFFRAGNNLVFNGEIERQQSQQGKATEYWKRC